MAIFKGILSALGCLDPLLMIAALIAAVWIPRQIMVNQIFADLVKEYRSTEMGAAVFSVFRFFVKDCGKDVGRIAAVYKEKYDQQIGYPLEAGIKPDYDNALHFQRRMVSQFYSDMARLRYDRRFIKLSAKAMKFWFTPREVQLLAILLHMVKPASSVFEESGPVSEPPQDEVPMNDLIYKLYEEVRDRE
jgi:hypothetical protein